MATRCAVPVVSKDVYRNRSANLKEILELVNEGAYSPSKLHGFLSTAKQNSVARFVPVFTYADTAVYFNCLQSVDKRLAAAAVPDTFGGWQLGGARRDMERQQALAMFGEDSQSIPQSCYNRAAWVQNWNQFWKLVAARHENSEDNAWFAMFDIANFYDSIDLRRLETSVRAVSPGFHFPINVLFHLLRTWNRGHCLYSESTQGLPMDVVGDCSRLLANFYLTSTGKVHDDLPEFIPKDATRDELELAARELKASIEYRQQLTSVRAVSPGFHFPINVLFHLLRTWNRGHCLYSESTQGLPMDVVGDCSRLLANFYLTSTGKVHDDLPEFIPKDATRDELELAARELKASIEYRQQLMQQLGAAGNHGLRIADEQRLLYQVEQRLGQR